MAKAEGLEPGCESLDLIVPAFAGRQPAVMERLRELCGNLVDLKGLRKWIERKTAQPLATGLELGPKELTSDQLEQIRRTLDEDDGFVKALNLHRAMTGASLKETRDFVHSLQPQDVQDARRLNEAAYPIAQEHREGRLTRAQALERLAEAFPSRDQEACAKALFNALGAWEWKSPDGRHSAALEQAGEIRFGPAYFSLTIDSRRFGSRNFGDVVFWSPDSRFLVVQEWRSTRESDGPRTRLLAIELSSMREAAVDEAEGWVWPIEMNGSVLAYIKDSRGTKARLERDLSSI